MSNEIVKLKAFINWPNDRESPSYESNFPSVKEASLFSEKLKDALFAMVGRECVSIAVNIEVITDDDHSDSDDD